MSPVHGRYMKWEVSKQKSGLRGLHLNSALTPRAPDKELEAAEYRMELNTAVLNNGANVLQFSDIFNHMLINQLRGTFGAPFCPYCAPSPCLSDIRSFDGFFCIFEGTDIACGNPTSKILQGNVGLRVRQGGRNGCRVAA